MHERATMLSTVSLSISPFLFLGMAAVSKWELLTSWDAELVHEESQ
jgi:hypothetical protein